MGSTARRRPACSSRATSPGSIAPASQTRALATAQAIGMAEQRLGLEPVEPAVDQARQEASRPSRSD